VAQTDPVARVVGLPFAGCANTTVINRIEHVSGAFAARIP